VAVRNLNGYATGPYHRSATDSTFAIANHLNGAMSKEYALNASYGGSDYYASIEGRNSFVHTSFYLVPPCTHYDKSRPCPANDTSALNVTHPEWFGGWKDMTLHPDSGQLCWMNESMQVGGPITGIPISNPTFTLTGTPSLTLPTATPPPAAPSPLAGTRHRCT
jgi:hypothetical protein